jgi:CheY-like chemotaxis protein
MPRTTLIIDDCPQVRAVLREALAADGYRVLDAVDGVDGVLSLRADEDLV